MKNFRWHPVFFFCVVLGFGGVVGLLANTVYFELFYEAPPSVSDLKVAAALKALEKSP